MKGWILRQDSGKGRRAWRSAGFRALPVFLSGEAGRWQAAVLFFEGRTEMAGVGVAHRRGRLEDRPAGLQKLQGVFHAQLAYVLADGSSDALPEIGLEIAFIQLYDKGVDIKLDEKVVEI